MTKVNQEKAAEEFKPPRSHTNKMERNHAGVALSQHGNKGNTRVEVIYLFKC